MTDLRCENRKLGALTPEGHLEIKCRDRFCGAGEGFVVLHTFDLKSGELVHTNRFKDPARRRERE